MDKKGKIGPLLAVEMTSYRDIKVKSLTSAAGFQIQVTWTAGKFAVLCKNVSPHCDSARAVTTSQQSSLSSISYTVCSFYISEILLTV